MIDSSAIAGQPRSPNVPERGALIHLGTLGEAGLLGVLGDDTAERL